MKVTNVRGYALEIAATGQVVEPGEDAEVSDELGRSLCEQPANWVAPKSASKSKAGASGESKEDA